MRWQATSFTLLLLGCGGGALETAAPTTPPRTAGEATSASAPDETRAVRIAAPSTVPRRLAIAWNTVCALVNDRLACWAPEPVHTVAAEGAVDLVVGDGFASIRVGTRLRNHAALGEPEVIAMDRRGDRTCIVLPDGTAECADGSVRAPLAGATGVVDVAVGEDFVCVLTAEGRVLCRSGEGPLSQVIGVTDARRLAVTDATGCVLDAAGAPWCWGDGSLGARGTGDDASPDAPNRVEGVVGDDIVAGGGSFCVRDGARWTCWGRDWYGTLGRGAAAARRTPGVASAFEGADEVALDGAIACIRRGADVSCLGAWSAGVPIDHALEDVRVVFPPGTVAGTGHLRVFGDVTCVQSDGRLVCVGDAPDGPDGSTAASLPRAIDRATFEAWLEAPLPDEPAALDQILFIEGMACARVGTRATCVLSDGMVMRSESAREVALGYAGACILDTSLRCLSADGPFLGLGDQVVSALNDARSGEAPTVAIGDGFACASSGTGATCFGLVESLAGELPRFVDPMAIDAHGRSSVHASASDVCVRGRGVTECWGGTLQSEYGEEVDVGRYAEVVAADEWFCGRTTSGQVRCWDRSSEAWPIEADGRATELAAGRDHVCATRADGAVICWGNGSSGQLGAPSTVSLVPLPMPGGT